MGGSDDEFLGEKTVVVHAFSPGSFFADRFRVEGRLGAGATGSVFAATDLLTSKRVALKVLRSERLNEAGVLERFQREAAILAKLGHPGIVEIVSFESTDDGAVYIAMELIEGDTLRKVLASKKRLTPLELGPIVLALGEALDAAHAVGAVHRDLKPDNILLTHEGVPPAKILDFGLGTLPGDMSLTGRGELIGTPKYMAPEQLRSARTVDRRADIYSLGVIMFEALSGVSPYDSADYGQIVGSLMEERRRKLSQHAQDLPPDLVAVVERALAFDPDERYGTAGQLGEEFASTCGLGDLGFDETTTIQAPKTED